MLSVSDIKTEIFHNIFTKYCNSMLPCKTYADLEAPSVDMMQQIIDLIKPNHSVKVVDRLVMPQEEEVKGDQGDEII
jgi:hypothetical protein